MKSQVQLALGLFGFFLMGIHPFASAQTAREQHPDMSYMKGQTATASAKEKPAVVTADGYYDNLEAAKKEPAKVVRLNLQNHGLKTIPTDLCRFPNLVELDLSHNQITSLAVDFQCPSNLKKLYLNHNQITEIPARIAQLPQLQVLVAHDNPVARIDPAIGNMGKLKELWLSGNDQSSSFQAAIWKLKGLETLRLWHFGLQSIPDAVGQMTGLKTFCVAHNAITALNPTVCTLPALDYLNLGDNALQSLPMEINRSTRLTYLGIYDNPIATLPEDIAVLSKHLDWLSAWNTNIPPLTQSQVSKAFANTKVSFVATDIH